MNFLDSLKAVLGGKPDEAVADHQEVAKQAIEAIRAHDKPAHDKAVADAKAEGIAEGKAQAPAPAANDDAKVERERCAAIVESAGAAGLDAKATSEIVKAGEPLEKSLQAVITRAAAKNPNVQSPADYSTTSDDTGGKRLIAAAEQIAGQKPKQ